MDESNKSQSDHREQITSVKHETASSTEVASHHAVLTSILETNPVKTWGRGSLHLYAICLLVYLCSTMNGEPNPINIERSVAH